ncbi:MAG: hypothetical protein ABW167_17850, partial [Baekduia sp.]
DTLVTADATTQADLFSSQSSGGGPEPTACRDAAFGKTVWYSFQPDRRGVVEVRTGGYDTVVSVFRYAEASSALGALVDCDDKAGAGEDLFARVEPGMSYAIQVGGADRGTGPASGTLQVTVDLFGDRDADDVFDQLDQCPDLRGIGDRGGCPPRLRTSPVLRWTTTASGVRVVDLRIPALPRGTSVQLRCQRRCGLSQTLAMPRGGTANLRALARRGLSNGASVELRLTHPAAGGDYAYGAIGEYFRYDVRGHDVRRLRRCLLPGSSTPRRSCR